METAFNVEFITKVAAIAGVFIYCWQGLRKVPTREDLEKLRTETNTRIDSRVSKAEYEERMKSLDEDMKEVKEALVRSEEHNRQDFAEVRRLLQQKDDT